MTMNMRTLFLTSVVATGFALSAAPQSAHASTATASISVSAAVLANCGITAAPLAFGTYATTTVANTTTVIVTCTNTTSYNVGLDAGQGSGATVALRKMTNGSSTLGYTLTTDSGHVNTWGSTIGTNTQAQTGSGVPQTFTVYGQILGNQPVIPGTYTDVVTATVTY